MPPNQDETEWLATVIRSAGVNQEAVEQVLLKRRIMLSPVAGTPRRLLLRRIEFSGVKEDVVGAGPFEFRWDGLAGGLWAMVTERNLKGKSTIMEMVRWLLRGRPSERLQEDVRRWTKRAKLRFGLDENIYEVRVVTEDGLAGDLIQLAKDGGERRIAEFQGAVQFEMVMANFFMREFALEAVTNFQKGVEEGEGKAVSHSWPALSGVMFIGTDYSSLLGDLPSNTGLPLRLMQMYLGLPWVSTLTAARAVVQEITVEQEAANKRRNAFLDQQSARVETIQNDLERKRGDLAGMPSDERIRAEIAAVTAEFAEKNRVLPQAIRLVSREEEAIAQAEAAFAEDRRDLQTFIDAEAAGAVFKMLDPSCCPRCEHAIGRSRKEKEKSDHACSVCGEVVASDEDTDILKAALESRRTASQDAVAQAKTARDAAQNALTVLQNRIQTLNTQTTSLAAQATAFGIRNQLETEIVVLEARLAEASRGTEPAEPQSDDLRILRAVVDETESRVKSQFKEVLKDVSTRLTSYAQRFGIKNLSGADLKGNMNLYLTKGGGQTSYSKTTEGEQLRLKIATVLAMVSVAETRGLGRHPGLLMIDSPGAQEVTQEDLEELIKGLEEVAKEFQHLQVFVAAARTPAIMAHIPPERMKLATGDQALW